MVTTTEVPTHRFVEHVMGMPISLALRGRHADTSAGRAAWAAVMSELQQVDAMFSTYRSDSTISRLGRGEIELADCPAEVIEVLELGRQASEVSDGAFSIFRPLHQGERPRLDTDGVVKGWAADRASAYLAVLDDTDFCLSAGGDIVGRAAADRAPWQIGIEDPHDTSRIVAIVPLAAGAIATSGTARRGNHLVDARTGNVPEGIASVTVIGPSLTWADIDATAAYAQGSRAAAWLSTRPIDSALVITPSGGIVRVVPKNPTEDR